MNRLVKAISGLLVAGLVSATSFSAQAQDVTVGLEAGIAAPLTAPQTDRFSIGGQGAVRVNVGLTNFLDLAPGVSGLVLSGANNGETGAAVGVGGGLRVKRPRDASNKGAGLDAISPWLDSNAQYVRTGVLNRFGWDVGVGAAVPTSDERNLWVGPYVRFASVFNDIRDGFDTRDSKTLVTGLSLEIGPTRKKTPEKVVEVQRVPYCPDRDKDGVPDAVDRCPDVPGPISNHGCPEVKEVVVPAPAPEALRQSIQFKLDSANLDASAKAALNVVVGKLAKKSFKVVVVEGHTSSEGPVKHNNALSVKRAKAVADYLVSRGVPRDHVTVSGLGSSKPVAPNDTEAGRVRNRRAEFVVSFIVCKEGK